MSETTLEIEDGVAVFTLNRPEKMNAISQTCSTATCRIWSRA